MALLPQMRRQDKDTDTTAHGIRGLSSILPKVQIHLRDPFQGRENGRNQDARRLDAVQTDRSVCIASIVFRPEVKEKGEPIMDENPNFQTVWSSIFNLKKQKIWRNLL